MKAKLTISGNENFTLYLIPETDAEREILRRVSECRELTCADRLKERGYFRETDHIEIFRMPPTTVAVKDAE